VNVFYDMYFVDCPDCDGTGKVHSHNPICPTCRGRGTVPQYYIDRDATWHARLDEHRKRVAEFQKTDLDGTIAEFREEYPDCDPYRVIQLRWTDEEEWKNVYPFDAARPADVQLAALANYWAQERVKHGLKHDAEFRVHP
jgi:endogenous inhibitor of DNA gyrase (YacG/DUF329 family)